MRGATDIPRSRSRRRAGPWAVLLGFAFAGAAFAVHQSNEDLQATRAHRHLADLPIAALSTESRQVTPALDHRQQADLERQLSEVREFLAEHDPAAAARLLSELRTVFDPPPCAWHLAAAEVALASDDQSRALAELAAATRADPQNPEAWLRLARVQADAGAAETAIAALLTATRLSGPAADQPVVTAAWYELSQLLADEGYVRAAVDAASVFDRRLNETYREHRHAAAVRLVLQYDEYGGVADRLEWLAELDEQADVVALAKEARARWPGGARFVDAEIAGLLGLGDADAAFALGRERLEAASDASTVRRRLLRLTVRAGRMAQQLDAWIDAWLEGSSGIDAQRLAALAAELESVGEGGMAERVLAALCEREPANADFAWRLARARRQSLGLAAALETLSAFVRRNDAITSWDFERFTTWNDQVALAEAWSALIGSTSDQEPDFADSFVRGALAIIVGDEDSAAVFLDRALAERADFLPARSARIVGRLARFDWGAAESAALSALEAAPDHADLWWLLARARDGLDAGAPVIDAYKRACKLSSDNPRYRVALAQHYDRLGRPREAQRYYAEALQLDPGDPAALDGLVAGYLIDGKPALAQVAYDNYIANLDDRAAARRIALRMQVADTPTSAESIAALRGLVADAPDDFAAVEMLARALLARGAFAQVAELVVPRMDESRAAEPLRSINVERLAAQGDFAAALEKLLPLVERYPNRAALVTFQARLLQMEFRVAEARELLVRLLDHQQKQSPDEPSRARVELLRTFDCFGDFDAGLTLIDRWLASNAELAAPLFEWRIRLLMHKGAHDAAADVMRDALGANIDPWVLTRALLGIGAFDAALRELDQIPQGNDPDPRYMQSRAYALIGAGDAQAAYKFVHEWPTDRNQALAIQRRKLLAECQSAAGNYELAQAEYEALLAEGLVQGLERNAIENELLIVLVARGATDAALDLCDEIAAPTDPPEWALRRQRSAYEASGDNRQVERILRALLELIPLDAGLNNDLAYTLADNGRNLDESLRRIRLSVGLHTLFAYDTLVSPAPIDTLGWVYYKRGDFESAARWLGRARDLPDYVVAGAGALRDVELPGPDDPVILDHLGDAYHRLDRYDDAVEAWRQAAKTLEALGARRTWLEQRTLEQARGKVAAAEAGRPIPVALTAEEQSSTRTP